MARHSHLSVEEMQTLVACAFNIEPDQIHSYIVMVDYGEGVGELEHCHAAAITPLDRSDQNDRIDLLRFALKFTNLIEHGEFV